MNPIITESIEILRQLTSYYQSALALGEELGAADADRINNILDERFRIVQRTTILMARFKLLQEDIRKQPIQPAELGFLNEQKARIKDMAPKFMEQERRVFQRLRTRMNAVQQSMVGHNQSAMAIRQYLSAPQAKPFV